jgi:CheY-like chemotaxis protein
VLSSRTMIPSSVLVIEHDPMQRQLIDLLFSVDGYELTMVATGEEALAYLREHTPAAVLIAADLPDVPGTTICERLKSVSRLARVPVVLIAPETPDGVLSDAARRGAHHAGAELVVQKPLGDKNLRERVQRLMTASTLSDADATPQVPASGIEFASGVSSTPTDRIRPNAPATELGGLRAEVARLREENDKLKLRVTKYRALAQELERTLEEERRRPRGLFGRKP